LIAVSDLVFSAKKPHEITEIEITIPSFYVSRWGRRYLGSFFPRKIDHLSALTLAFAIVGAQQESLS
jgi:hypothetical protein